MLAANISRARPPVDDQNKVQAGGGSSGLSLSSLFGGGGKTSPLSFLQPLLGLASKAAPGAASFLNAFSGLMSGLGKVPGGANSAGTVQETVAETRTAAEGAIGKLKDALGGLRDLGAQLKQVPHTEAGTGLMKQVAGLVGSLNGAIQPPQPLPASQGSPMDQARAALDQLRAAQQELQKMRSSLAAQ